MVAGVQSVEIGNTVDPEQHRLTVDDERGLPVTQRSLDDQRVTGGPIMAIAREQPDPLAITDDQQAIAIVLYFVKPIRTGRDRGPALGEARFEGWVGHAV